jgi:MoaA/NifB/PqqE/SkfB family radical SAM enzyme
VRPRIIETGWYKFLVSDEIKSFFNKRSGYTKTWGRTKEDDPSLCRFGPLIADIELTTACEGVGRTCPECYKSNRPEGQHMTLGRFKELFAKMPKTLQQIAFGLGDTPSADGTRGNPDTFAIFEHCRKNGVIPNCTINGWRLDKADAERLAKTCGAVAVSRYPHRPDVCYDAVKMLTDAGLTQTNIHCLVSQQHLSDCHQLLEDATTDPRLAKLNAIVFLSAKQKGRGTWLNPVPADKYKELIDAAFQKGVRIGFDSCSAHKFLKAIEGHHKYELLSTYTEPCESGLFSAYIDVTGTYYPCSFATGETEGIDLFRVDNFMEVWTGPNVASWRRRLLDNERRCPLYAI